MSHKAALVREAQIEEARQKAKCGCTSVAGQPNTLKKELWTAKSKLEADKGEASVLKEQLTETQQRKQEYYNEACKMHIKWARLAIKPADPKLHKEFGAPWPDHLGELDMDAVKRLNEGHKEARHKGVTKAHPGGEWSAAIQGALLGTPRNGHGDIARLNGRGRADSRDGGGAELTKGLVHQQVRHASLLAWAWR
ncbi:hypothetical protein CBOM_01034 [Ceraceosorus bombacis]|uniref:Uncharacterized protein n=1 Tax=Ceraceosorus bombacis TaxID=401625 RepID=A0A0P1BBG9_9BASI|nr:hypothetical protein CBOM_01034 [Ceraceosorus bombacis]